MRLRHLRRSAAPKPPLPPLPTRAMALPMVTRPHTPSSNPLGGTAAQGGVREPRRQALQQALHRHRRRAGVEGEQGDLPAAMISRRLQPGQAAGSGNLPS